MTSQNDLQALETAIQTYLDGVYEGDADKLASVFHPTSALTQFFDGELKIMPRDHWLELVRGRATPKSLHLPREDHVLAIDMVGPGLAHVKVRCQMPPRYFTDLLSFLKINGDWQVVQKVYMTDVRN